MLGTLAAVARRHSLYVVIVFGAAMIVVATGVGSSIGSVADAPSADHVLRGTSAPQLLSEQNS
jgi:hypothetical protein